MRPIKFRAWHKPSSAMMMVHTLHWNGNGECIGGYCHDEEWNEIAVDVTHTILMQFTGLHDKNGKEIFEGDILKSEGETKTQPFNFNKEVRDPWWEISEVVFEGGRFGQIVRTQHNSYFGELPSPFRDIFRPEEYKEVIGNIYEHPEMLKEPNAYNQD